MNRPFELRVVRQEDRDYGLALYQEPANGRNALPSNGNWSLVARTWGTPLKSVINEVLTVIREAGYRTTELSRNRQAPFALTEAQGVRLGLLFLAVKPLRKVARMASISEQVREMTEEEIYYWFSKATAASTARRAPSHARLAGREMITHLPIMAYDN
jgi:hypothetical protein